MPRHNLSEQGRLRCAAAGNQNLQAWRNGEVPAGTLDFERKIESIRAQLEERAAPIPEPARGILITSAVAQFSKLHLIQRQLLRRARLSARTPLGADDLAPLTSNLLRTLRALGMVDGAADDANEPSPAEWLARRAEGGA